MKQIIVTICAAAILTGCAAIAPASSFDAVLYNNFVELVTTNAATQNYCDANTMRITQMVQDLELRARAAVTYTTYSSIDVKPLATVINDHYKQMALAYALGTPSDTYCRTKLDVASVMINTVLSSLAKKPK
jgi:hypothetical protein